MVRGTKMMDWAKMLVNHNPIKNRKTIQFSVFLTLFRRVSVLRGCAATIDVRTDPIDVRSDLIYLILRRITAVSPNDALPPFIDSLSPRLMSCGSSEQASAKGA